MDALSSPIDGGYSTHIKQSSPEVRETTGNVGNNNNSVSRFANRKGLGDYPEEKTHVEQNESEEGDNTDEADSDYEYSSPSPSPSRQREDSRSSVGRLSSFSSRKTKWYETDEEGEGEEVEGEDGDGYDVEVDDGSLAEATMDHKAQKKERKNRRSSFSVKRSTEELSKGMNRGRESREGKGSRKSSTERKENRMDMESNAEKDQSEHIKVGDLDRTELKEQEQEIGTVNTGSKKKKGISAVVRKLSAFGRNSSAPNTPSPSSVSRKEKKKEKKEKKKQERLEKEQLKARKKEEKMNSQLEPKNSQKGSLAMESSESHSANHVDESSPPVTVNVPERIVTDFAVGQSEGSDSHRQMRKKSALGNLFKRGSPSPSPMVKKEKTKQVLEGARRASEMSSPSVNMGTGIAMNGTPTGNANRKTQFFSKHNELKLTSPATESPVSPPGPSNMVPTFKSGATAGAVGSGVLLEGWLKQKQRRGMSGMKQWNIRYFVLFAKYSEIRYYTDVVQSAWGPIPLGEIGAIPLRLIQRIGTPSHPKYKGCRFDITCRSSWGTHYADDFISSDEDKDKEKESPASSSSCRVYSLVADTPQVRVIWVTMLDSLLKRSENSPRTTDGAAQVLNLTPKSTPKAALQSLLHTPKGISSKREGSWPLQSTPENASDTQCAAVQHTRNNRRSLVDMENVVKIPIYDNGKDPIPYAVRVAIDFLEASTPGIELHHFYETQGKTRRIKAAIHFLNEISMQNDDTSGISSTDTSHQDDVLPETRSLSKPEHKPDQVELQKYLDSVTAGAVVKQWVYDMEQPLIPFSLYSKFIEVAEYAEDDPYDLVRNVQALVDALPPTNAQKLEYLIFHLAGVAEYARENKMPPAVLATVFSEGILRPMERDGRSSENDSRDAASRVVQYVISNAEAIF